MFRFISSALGLIIAAGAGSFHSQEPDPVKRKSAVILWVADAPQLTYDIRFAGGDSTTMPTALKYLVKDLAESEGWYLTGEDKSKTVASQAKRIAIEYHAAKSKPRAIRIGKIEIKEQPESVACTVTFAKKPPKEQVARTGEILEIFGRKYVKAAKSVRSTVASVETAKANVWSFEVRFKDPAAKDKEKNKK